MYGKTNWKFRFKNPGFIIIIIIIIIIIDYYYYPLYLLYAGYLHLYFWDKPCPWGTLCCSYSDVTTHGAHIASFCVDSIVSLR